jgi:L-rhamnose isomerase
MDVVIAEDGDVEMRSEMMRTVLYRIVHVGGSFFQSLIDHVNKDTNPRVTHSRGIVYMKRGVRHP